MADQEIRSSTADHPIANADEITRNIERTPPDGDSPPPTPPPRPSAKKWVHFDESSTPTPIAEPTDTPPIVHSRETEESELASRLPKPTAPPRRPNPPPPQENGSVLNMGGIMKSAKTNDQTASNFDMGGIVKPTKTANENGHAASDVAQISVSLEETVKPGRLSAMQQDLQSNVPSGTTRSIGGSADNRYENGKIITEKKPENKHCAWVTIARFDPYKMPKSLISDQLTMPVEDYVTAMEMLTNDFRFRSYTVLYRRLIAGWLVASLFILIFILISGMRGLGLFGLTLFWLFLTCGGVFACLFIKKRINRGLHNCVASVNKLLLRYNLLAGMEDRGRMSCHKIVIPFIYFDAKDCLPRIKQQLMQRDQTIGGTSTRIPSVTIDLDAPGTSAHGRPATVDERVEELILKFSQSYVKALVRRTIRFPSRPSEGVRDQVPLHCTHSYCLCQYLRKYYFEREPRKWYHKFCLDSDIPAQDEAGFSSTVVAYGYPPVVYG